MSHKKQAAAKIAQTAHSLCGTDFRLHGRDPADGLDCIGLAELCLASSGIECESPNGYSIRGGSQDSFDKAMTELGFTKFSPDSRLEDGDVVLARPSPVQWHFLVRSQSGFVHAHAGLGKVVFTPGKSPWPIVAIYRLLENR